MSGFNVLYARKTTFVDNSEILRCGFPCTFDRCASVYTTKESKEFSFGLTASPGSPVWLRANTGTAWRLEAAQQLKYAADDLEFIDLALGENVKLDERSTQIVEECQLGRHLPYWIRLFGHPNAAVRSKAVSRFEFLTGQKISPLPDQVAADSRRHAVNLDKEFARWMSWYDENCALLKWDEIAKRYSRPAQ
jgi:hypothetical protein